jgi:septal ring factor EnvC (AmiA/AmiB activator)
MKQKIIDFFEKNVHYIFMVVMVIMAGYATWSVYKETENNLNVNKLKEKLAQSEATIKALKKSNDSLAAYVVTQQSQILAKDNAIEFFKLKDEAVQRKIETINANLKTLNDKYEKASHYATNFNSDILKQAAKQVSFMRFLAATAFMEAF